MINQQQQQFDPMAQLMQLLEYQQRNKQLRQQGDLGNRELDIRGQSVQNQQDQLRQMGEQFQTGLDWDREQAGMRKEQFDAEMQAKMLAQAMEQSRFAQTNPLEQRFKEAQIANFQRNQDPNNNPQMKALEQAKQQQALEFLQQQYQLAQPGSLESQQLGQQLKQAAAQMFGSMIPPLPPMTIEQAKILKSTQQ